jgi:hypothetical protein
MKALTVRQPWASLIISGGKDIENRDWYTGFRGRVAIHSSSKLTMADLEDCHEFLVHSIPHLSLERFKRASLPLGSILGTVEITGCVRQSESPWFFGKYGFVLRNPQPLAKPIPIKGHLGFWDVPDDLLKREE